MTSKNIPLPDKRMKFIPGLRDRFVSELARAQISEKVVRAALDQWDAGGSPRTPVERGCFEVFADVQRQIDTPPR